MEIRESLNGTEDNINTNLSALRWLCIRAHFPSDCYQFVSTLWPASLNIWDFK